MEDEDCYSDLHRRWVKTTPQATQQLKDEGIKLYKSRKPQILEKFTVFILKVDTIVIRFACIHQLGIGVAADGLLTNSRLSREMSKHSKRWGQKLRELMY